MSWHFSRALVEAYSGASSSGGEPSALLSETPMPLAFYSPGRTTELSGLSRYGMTFKPLTDGLGVDLLTWFLEAFHVRTSAPLAQAQASEESAAACGVKWRESLARWDRATSSWRTPQCSLLADLDVYSETWPRWGIMLDGACWALQRSAVGTYEKGFGYLPTPRASEWAKGALRKAEMERHSPCLRAIFQHETGAKMPVEFAEWVMGWPVKYTAVEPLATDRFQQWLRSHGAFLDHKETS